MRKVGRQREKNRHLQSKSQTYNKLDRRSDSMARFSPARIRKDEGTPGDETYTRVSDFFGCI